VLSAFRRFGQVDLLSGRDSVKKVTRGPGNSDSGIIESLVYWVQEGSKEGALWIWLGKRDQRSIDGTGTAVRFLLLLGMVGDVWRIVVGLSTEAAVPLCQDYGHTARVEKVL